MEGCADRTEPKERSPTMDGGRVVVVTGASAGVGRAVAHAFARRGARLGLIARDRDALAEVCREVADEGGAALALPADVSRWQEVEDAARTVEARLGPISVWINNAMVTIFAPFERIAPEEYRRATDITYLGYVHGTLAALRRMKARDRGTIVQVGSALAYRSIPLQSVYCGAKAAIRGFTDSLRSELLHDRSRVHLTMVHLPAVNTPQFDWAMDRMPRKPRPVAPVYQPELIGEAIAWAADAGRREVWLGHMTVAAILAQRVAPGLLDRYLARTNYAAQQRPTPNPPDARSNLFAPVHGQHRTRGSFDGEARDASWQIALTRRKGRILLGILLAAGALAAGALAVGRPGRVSVSVDRAPASGNIRKPDPVRKAWA